MMAAEYTFTLPVGLVSPDGRAFQQGGMRLATALDEIEPMGDPRVRANEAYYGLLVLARVMTWLGPYRTVTPELVASLAALDFSYLQQVYSNLNSAGARMPQPSFAAAQAAPAPAPQEPRLIETQCPHCQAILELDLSQGVEAAQGEML
ncbi:hypothetical protein E7T06_11565 [Deinococcus sp. Arct2-2]|uniref:hypothetical protein n=1 Tax=Deinococcus sp. Arct2-2 TaxID=2568653 RepID=UPI0010A56F05|nr:hypothetical protein [Deinococcus sp. Arct2-2]THF69540.1 hypothetical protein E7T06_11565 [Deinococcus sp. Arct2-2]